MQTKIELNPFSCPLHPSEQIQRICLDINEEASLKCIECILSNKMNSKHELLSLEDFINFAAKKYEILEKNPASEESPPSRLIGFLDDEDEMLSKLCQHLEKEKEKASETFNTILQEFTMLIHTKKQETLKLLDKQLNSLRLNYQYFRCQIEKYYYGGVEEENLDNKRLAEKINQCKDTTEFELLIKNIKDDLFTVRTDVDPYERLKLIKTELGEFATELKRQSTSFPTTLFHSPEAVEESIQKLKKTLNPLFEEFTSLDHEIDEIQLYKPFSLDSKIIKQSEHIRLLNKWLVNSSERYIKLKLLYRGSRDGMNPNIFHEKCDDYDSTLVLARSEQGKVFGGYSDLSWKPTNNYKQSNNTWLFSLDEKEKFSVKKGNTQSIYAYAAYGPTFGGGHDLYINLTELPGSQSYSNLGHSYNCKQRNSHEKQIVLAGSYQFSVNEIEVFHVKLPKEESNLASLHPKRILTTLQRCNLF